MRIVIYTRPLCEGCQKLKSILDREGLDYEERPAERLLEGLPDGCDRATIWSFAQLQWQDSLVPVMVFVEDA